MIGQDILEVIAGTPDCRTIQIIDKLDMDAEEAMVSIAALLKVGDIVEADGKAPNGLSCTVYNLSDSFRASAAYAPLAAKARAKAFAAPGMNRVERAIEWVRQRGTATSAELHAVMDLRDDEAPSKVLSSAVTTKRLVKEGKNWTLGPGPAGEVSAPSPACAPKVEAIETPRLLPKAAPGPAAAAPAQAAPTPAPVATPEMPADLSAPAMRIFAELAGTLAPSAAPASTPKATRVRGTKPAPEAVAKALSAPAVEPIMTPAEKEPAAPAPDKVIVALRSLPETAAPVYRCALWSDGMIEVQRDGQTVAQVPQGAAEAMAKFIARLAGAKEAA